jgi:2-hydroxycyclohexanecarboxyl-CoA dehydrogenase
MIIDKEAGIGGKVGGVAVVTGGAQGIGRSICERLITDGHTVVLMDIDGDRARETALELGNGTLGLQCDVANFDQMSQLAAEIEERAGICSRLVANVGWTPDKKFLDTSIEEQDRVIAVNYTGSLNATRLYLPKMQEQGFGRIVYISSDAARVGVAGEAVYAGAKAALIGFAKSLSVEVARVGVTVNVVCPGSTDTELLRNMFNAEQIEKRLKIHPMRRFAKPSDLANAVAFFLNDDADFITGQVLSVNGGMLRAG